ncbi:MAG: radical SAM protein [Denitrovibrio sp.]|nr:MAG: radical SAM protein [Denitrovibrio sp.]
MTINIKAINDVFYHIKDKAWRFTPDGDSRGYIQPKLLKDLWFHTGTACNLNCPFCFEGSSPGNDRLQMVTLSDIQPFFKEAVSLGVSHFSFTGGETFVNGDMIKILDCALDINPCLVLTNATDPLAEKFEEIEKLKDKKHKLSFRVSLDYPYETLHDKGRGEGNFRLSLKMMSELNKLGFKVSVARKQKAGEDKQAEDSLFLPVLKEAGLPEDTNIVSFPELYTPGSLPEVPQITEACMTTYKTEEERAQFMCSYSKMVVKIDGKMLVYACTLVDDDPDYTLGDNLTDAMRARVMLRHHRCFSCFASGTSCSE